VARQSLPGINKVVARRGALLALAVLFSSPFVVEGAQPPNKPHALPWNAAELETFLDPLIRSQMESSGIPGAVFVLVQGEEVVLARGYGVADREKTTAVDPANTLFYIASLTKVFTATAVLQLVEEKKLDLWADVNDYLDKFHLAETYPEPVTLAHLLTHTAGFDDKNIGYVALTAAETLPLGAYLAQEMPPRVMPPGQVLAYSNHGYGLAGHIVERASGLPYADYLETRIFRPLGMRQSTARVPPQASLAKDLATGYHFDIRARGLRPQPLGFRNLPPAGAVSTTALDMARFLSAHLQLGRLGEVQILQEETARTMHQRQFSHHPRLPGVTFGFMERFQNDVRVLQHPGGYIGFSALLLLAPEEDWGMFIAGNGSRSGWMYKVLGEFLDRRYPVRGAQSVGARSTPVSPPEFAAELTGSFHSTRYSRGGIEKIAILDSQLYVDVAPNGFLRVRPKRGEASYWAEVEPLFFRRQDGDDYLAFRRDENGRITHMFLSLPGSAVPTGFEKLSWRDSFKVQLSLVASLTLVFLSALTVWPFTTLGFRWAQRKRGKAQAYFRHLGASLLAAGAALLGVLFTLGVEFWIGNSQYRLKLIYGMTSEMVALLWLGVVMAVLTLLVACFAVQAWRKQWWSLPGRLYYSLLTVAALAYVWFLSNWNILGFRY
jgi:CubicO group peptidase (beta-lactamase class C family)